jgi:proteasome lid subunit RPN8/RPN11
VEGILAHSRDVHPKEIMLLLRGEHDNNSNDFRINEVVIPPSAIHGSGFSTFQPHMLPFDLSILGTVHSHPSGALRPSTHDLNHFYGRIMMIVAYPYSSIEDIAIYDGKGRTVPFKIAS